MKFKVKVGIFVNESGRIPRATAHVEVSLSWTRGTALTAVMCNALVGKTAELSLMQVDSNVRIKPFVAVSCGSSEGPQSAHLAEIRRLPRRSNRSVARNMRISEGSIPVPSERTPPASKCLGPTRRKTNPSNCLQTIH